MPFYQFLEKTRELLQVLAKQENFTVPKEEDLAKWCTQFLINSQLSDKLSGTKWKDRRELLEKELQLYNHLNGENSGRCVSKEVLFGCILLSFRSFDFQDAIHVIRHIVDEINLYYDFVSLLQ